MVTQYEPYDVLEDAIPRPEWHSNLRWFCAILSIILLTLSLVVLSLWRASKPDVALPLLQGALVTVFFPQGVVQEQLEYWQQQSASISEIQLLDGIDMGYVPEDLRGLSAEEASLALVRPLSTMIMTQGVRPALHLVQDDALKERVQTRVRDSLEGFVQESLAQVFFEGTLSSETLQHWQQRLADAQRDSLSLLDGVNVQVGAEALAGLNPEEASIMLIAPLLRALESEGAQAALEYITDEGLRARIRQRMGNEGIAILNQVWLQELFPQGISSSERSAWRAQLSASPYASIELAPGLTVSLTRDALNNDGLDTAFNQRLEPISRAYLSEGQAAALALLGSRTQPAFAAAMPEALGAMRTLIAEELYPTGLNDALRVQMWRNRLADLGKGSLALIPDIPQRYTQQDIENLEVEEVEKVLLAPLIDDFIAQGKFASVRKIEDADLSATILDSYEGIEDRLTYVLALELFGTLDDEARLQHWRQRLDAPNQWVEGLPSYLSQPLSPELLENLRPREAALQLLQPMAQAIYDADTQQLYDEAMQNRIQAHLQPLNFLTPRGRQLLLWTLLACVALTALTLALCLGLSDGLAKLVNVGLVMIVAALPITLLSWWVQLQLRDALAPQPPQHDMQPLWDYLQGYSGYLLGFVPRHFINFVTQLHVGLLICGVLLFLIASSLGLGQRWQQRSL